MWLELLVATCLRAPVPGHVIEAYAPIGTYGGHHGIDLHADVGTPVRAAGNGTISFAGSVAGMLTVTIDHGGNLRSTVSYLGETDVASGARVATGQVLGSSGLAHETDEAVHFSVRVGDSYTDPVPYLQCGGGGPERLYLLPPPAGSYARQRAQWDHGRNLRSPPYRPPACRRGRLSPAGSGSGHLPSRWLTLAEGRKTDQFP